MAQAAAAQSGAAAVVSPKVGSVEYLDQVSDRLDAAGARPIVVSGDSHSFWANDLHDAAGKRIAAEFGTTGITSPGYGDILPGLPLGVAHDPMAIDLHQVTVDYLGLAPKTAAVKSIAAKPAMAAGRCAGAGCSAPTTWGRSRPRMWRCCPA